MQNEDAPPTSNPEQTLPEKNEIHHFYLDVYYIS